MILQMFLAVDNLGPHVPQHRLRPGECLPRVRPNHEGQGPPSGGVHSTCTIVNFWFFVSFLWPFCLAPSLSFIIYFHSQKLSCICMFFIKQTELKIFHLVLLHDAPETGASTKLQLFSAAWKIEAQFYWLELGTQFPLHIFRTWKKTKLFNQNRKHLRSVIRLNIYYPYCKGFIQNKLFLGSVWPQKKSLNQKNTHCFYSLIWTKR